MGSLSNQIISGDAREFSSAIPAASVDLIFTDPVYDDLSAYDWLAWEASRVLKPDGLCLVWFGTKYLKAVLEVMIPPLFYRWQLVEIQVFNGIKAGTSVISSRHNDCLWLEKTPGHSRAYTRIWDVSNVSKKERPDVPLPRNNFAWSKHPVTVQRWLEAFTQPGDVVFDPFTGYGTVPALCRALGRQYIAYEIDAERAEYARERVALTQPILAGFGAEVKKSQPAFVL